MNIAIATCDKVPKLTNSEQKLMYLLGQIGLHLIPVVWDDPVVEWSSYDVIIIRSVWDYHVKIKSFLDWLSLLEQSDVRVLNDINTIRANHNKFYLKKLIDKGIKIIPTQFISNSKGIRETDLLWEKAVIKPAISASSYRTKLFDKSEWEKIQTEYASYEDQNGFLIQKFMPEIQSSGELSVIFFNRKFSHAILKKAKENEFRVQSDYGGSAELYTPPYHIISSALKVLSRFTGDILYARIDGIIINDEFVLMEAELIEPELFLDYADGAKEAFVTALIELLNYE